MLKDYFTIAVNGIKTRRARSLLTIIGIFIGITAIISLISIGQGMQNAITQEFEEIGTNRIIITAGGAQFGPMGGSLATSILTEKDVDVVKRVRGVKTTIGMLTQTKRAEYKNELEYSFIYGIPTDTESTRAIEEVGLFEIEKGREFKSNDKYKVILGNIVANEFFDNKKVSIGDKLLIDNNKFEVIGIQKKIGTGVHDLVIRIPLSVARELFNVPEEISTIFVTTGDGFTPMEVAERIEKELRDYRDVDEGEEDFSVQTAEQSISQLNSILDIIQIVLVGIASISLIVGSIGIMNTMYTAIMERRREIGIMKAVGARNSDILKLFLVESGILGLIGGVVGVIIGLGFSKSAEIIANLMGVTIFKAYISAPLILGALTFSFVVGAVSGVLPAYQASQLKPIEALGK